MYNIVTGVGTFLKTSDIKIDYEVFRLHYTFTVGIFLTFFVIVTTKQFAGDPILCETGEQAVSKNVISVDVPHPGIASSQDTRQFYFLKYYQWIYFMLFFQAVLFYTPRFIWKNWEGEKMKTLTKDFENALLHEDQLEETFKGLTSYLIKTWSTNNAYAMKYFFCEFLTLVNVVGQFFLLDLFFDGQYLSYGYNVVAFYNSDKFINSGKPTVDIQGDPMIMLFPRVTKCIFRKFGRTSLIEVHDVLCIMALNIINEKIYLFLWFWLIILGFLTAITLLMDFLIIVSANIRIYALQMRFYLIAERDLRILVQSGSYGDWFLMDLLGRNMDHIIFKNVVQEISNKFSDQKKLMISAAAAFASYKKK
ncbi:innexin shaking-B [Caerostris extrusa]|uniref:Innexin n=1 Tax=Caerostris extrusa TaxID=172846 RepID=A0AAV4R849_CAEEX|nr:innexin shaking-B [Caerostris extrusa]